MVKYTEEEYREAAEKWRKENPTLKKIPVSTVVEISNGKIVPLGKKMSNMRQNSKTLINGGQEFWSKFGLEEEKAIKFTEEEYREAAEKWRKENPTAKRIPAREVIKISNGKEVPLGSRMANMRKHPEKLSDKQKEYWSKFGLLEEKKVQKKFTEEEYREAAEKWRKANPTAKKITRNEVIEISSGKKVPLGARMHTMRENLETLSDEQKEYWSNFGLFYKKEKATKKLTTLEKYIEIFNGDEEKAKRVVESLKSLREQRKQKKKEEYNIENILKEFDIDINMLKKYLERTRNKEVRSEGKTLTYQGQTLRAFCIKNGYNYEVIKRAIKLHEFCEHDTLEQLINRAIIDYNKKGQKGPSVWIYEKYGNLAKHILLYLNLDSKGILSDMTNYTISLEEAIRHDIFKRTNQTKENAWLEELYNFLIEEIDENKENGQTIEDIVEMFTILVKEYRLTKEEYQLLWDVFSKYVNVMKEYQKIDVGLEGNYKRKIEKIRSYGLDEEEIEESFFIPLEFDKGLLLGRQTELWKRRQLLRQYIIDWDYYTDDEKVQIKKENNFTEEEMNYIEKTRLGVNQTIEEVKKRK